MLRAEAASGTSGFANGGTTGPEVFGTTDGFIDLDVTDDGRFLYQLEGLSGAISAYAVGRNGSLRRVGRNVGNLPEIDTQGLITVSSPRNRLQALLLAFLIKLKLALGLL